MDPIRAVFERLRHTSRKALIPFIMGGDPDLPTTRELLRVLAEHGADLIEVGVPFSDPLADGPTIQRASSRALARGTSPEAVLESIHRMAARMPTPILLLSYWNPIVQYGRGRSRATDPTPFLRDARAAGCCGVIVPDLPVEEGQGFRQAALRAGVAPIFLAAPTSPPQRLRRIARCSEGLIYYVSLTGTTGARRHLSPDWRDGVRQLKLITTKPVCVGFGISTPAQAASVARVADGVIVGSALIRTMEPHLRHRRALLNAASSFLRRLRRVV